MAGGLKDYEWRMLCQWAKDQLPHVCWICELPIDMTLSGRNPWGWTLDHVLPRKTHPELAYEPSNVRPAHMRCNSRKKDGAVPRKPRSSRPWGMSF
jgi:5-methylcytosine-specific restriction endonuclease McrA